MANQNIISYTSKTYDTIFNDMVQKIPLLTDKWLNYAEDDPGIVLLKLMAATADMLCYNMDFQALENFPQKATVRTNAQNSYDLINYKMKWYESAITHIKLKYSPGTGQADYVIIPNYTQVFTLEGLVFTIMDDMVNRSLYANMEHEVKAVQGLLTSISGITQESITPDGRIYLGYQEVDYKNINISSFRVSDDVEIPEYRWNIVDDLNTYLEVGRVFEFRVDNAGNPYIRLCSNFEDYMTNVYLQISFLRTDGYDGNIGRDSLSKFGISIYDHSGNNVTNSISILSNTQTLNGADPESLSIALINARKHSGILDSAVVIEDFETMSETVENIRKCRCLEINVEDINVIHFDSFEHFPYINEDGDIVRKLPNNSIVPYNISYRCLYVDDLSELCYRLSRQTDSATLVYDRVDLLMQLITNDFTNPTTNSENSIDNVLRDKKVFCVNQQYTNGYTQIIPYNIVIYANEPYSEVLTNYISNNITNSLNEFYNSIERDFGEFIKYNNITSAVETSDSRIEYADVRYPKGNLQCEYYKYPRLGPVNVVMSDNPNLENVEIVIEDSINAFNENGSVSALSNRGVLNNYLFNLWVSMNQGSEESNKHFEIPDGMLPYDATHYLDPLPSGETPESIFLTDSINLVLNKEGQIIIDNTNRPLDELSLIYMGEQKKITYNLTWYTSRPDIVHIEERAGGLGGVEGVVENTQFSEDSDIELYPMIGIGDCKFSLGERIKLIKRGVYN